jgi:hypothetical protein
MNKENVVSALVTEAFIATLKELEPGLSPAARARKAKQMTAECPAEETLDIYNEYTRL